MPEVCPKKRGSCRAQVLRAWERQSAADAEQAGSRTSGFVKLIRHSGAGTVYKGRSRLQQAEVDGEIGRLVASIGAGLPEPGGQGVIVDAYGATFPGSAYAERGGRFDGARGRSRSATPSSFATPRGGLGGSGTGRASKRDGWDVDADKIEQQAEQEAGAGAGAADGIGSDWQDEESRRKAARLIREESVATALNCAAVLSAMGQHYAAMSRLDEVRSSEPTWSVLAF